MRPIIILSLLCLAVSCNKKSAKNSLDYYLEENNDLSRAELIACAASIAPTASDNTHPTNVFSTLFLVPPILNILNAKT